MPKDKVTCKSVGYGFVEYRSEEDADYAMKVLNMIKLYGKPIKVNKASQDKKVFEVGANIFIGNLDPDVDEKLLHDTFSAFGSITQTPKILYDPDTGISKGYGFVSFDSFEASDLAIECMNGQFLCNRAIVVQYAYKKDTPGERHGSQAERILAASQPQKAKPHTLFSSGMPDGTSGVGLTAAMQQQSQQQQFQMTMLQQQQMLMSMQNNPYMNMGMGMNMMGMMGMGMAFPPLPMPMPPSLPDYMQGQGGVKQTPPPIPPPPPSYTAMSAPPFGGTADPPVPIPPPPPILGADLRYSLPPMPVPPPPPQ